MYTDSKLQNRQQYAFALGYEITSFTNYLYNQISLYGKVWDSVLNKAGK